MRRRVLVALAVFVTAVSGLGATTVTPASAAATPVMGRSVLTPADLVGWYRSTGKVNRATVGIDALAGYFISEGNDEGVAGDLAFAQSIVETGYFGFSARVLPEYNNFSGLGAVDSGTGAEHFPDARTGVRAQIQHLRAYADPTVTTARLAHPLVDTRFALVSPKGKAPRWDDFGGGIWATDPGYSAKVLGIHQSIVEWARRYGASRFAPFANADGFVRRGFQDILFRSGSTNEIKLWTTVLNAGTMTPEAFLAALLRGEAADTAQPVTRLYLAGLGRQPERGGLAFWSGRQRAGQSIDELARQLLGSNEFARRYGSPAASGYVELLYLNVLGRSPDAAGAAFWGDRLRSGRTTPANLLVQFSESKENKARVAYLVEVTISHLGLIGYGPTADDIETWRIDRSRGEPLESLTYRVVTDPRFLARR